MRLWPLLVPACSAQVRDPITLARFVSIVVLCAALLDVQTVRAQSASTPSPQVLPARSCQPAGQSAAAAADTTRGVQLAEPDYRVVTIPTTLRLPRHGSLSAHAPLQRQPPERRFRSPATCSAWMKAQSSASVSLRDHAIRAGGGLPHGDRQDLSVLRSTMPCIRPPRNRSRSQGWVHRGQNNFQEIFTR